MADVKDITKNVKSTAEESGAKGEEEGSK